MQHWSGGASGSNLGTVRRSAGKAGSSILGVLMLLCGICMLAPGAALAGTVDQQQTDHGGGSRAISSGGSLAQTFTAGASGALDQVDLYLTAFNSPIADMNVQIRSLSGDSPGDAVLASQSVSASMVSSAGGFVPFNFTAPATVVAGTRYALVADSPAMFPHDDAWTLSSATNPYTGGAPFTNPTSPPSGPWSPGTTTDFAFRTYVTAPPTGERAAALKKCKKKHSRKARKKCRKKAKRRPL